MCPNFQWSFKFSWYLLSSDLLQTIDDTMFGNHFANQHRFDYPVPIDNENDVDNC